MKNKKHHAIRTVSKYNLKFLETEGIEFKTRACYQDICVTKLVTSGMFLPGSRYPIDHNQIS